MLQQLFASALMREFATKLSGQVRGRLLRDQTDIAAASLQDCAVQLRVVAPNTFATVILQERKYCLGVARGCGKLACTQTCNQRAILAQLYNIASAFELHQKYISAQFDSI